MAILDLKASVFGLNWSEFHQKNKLNKAKPSQGKTAAQVEKTSTFNDKIVKKKNSPISPGFATHFITTLD